MCTEVEKLGAALVGEARLLFVSWGKMHDLKVLRVAAVHCSYLLVKLAVASGENRLEKTLAPAELFVIAVKDALQGLPEAVESAFLQCSV